MDFFNEVIVLTTDTNIFGPTELNYLEINLQKKLNSQKIYIEKSK